MLNKQYGHLIDWLERFKYIGWGLSAVLLFGIAYLDGGWDYLIGNMAVTACLGAVWFGFAWMVVRMVQSRFFLGLVWSLALGLFAATVTAMFMTFISPVTLVASLVFILVNLVAWFRLIVYTAEGAELHRQVEGFSLSIDNQIKREKAGEELDPFEVNPYRHNLSYRIALKKEKKLAREWSAMMRNKHYSSTEMEKWDTSGGPTPFLRM